MNPPVISDTLKHKKIQRRFLTQRLFAGYFLLIAILYTWPLQFTPRPVVQDLIEINLGNEKEGMGRCSAIGKRRSCS